tara:strand:+ start:770 stop:1192 length:423 start_codon:yes stop_codon:yes gene_type:complete
MSEYSIEELQKMLNEKIAQEKENPTYEIVKKDINLNFDISDIINTYTLHHTEVTNTFLREEKINRELFDNDDNLKMDLVNDYVNKYLNDWIIKREYGKNYSIEDMDIDMDITWNVNIKSLKKMNTPLKELNIKMPKLKKL